MLEELSDHLMDIAMNSVRAGAKNVGISVVADKSRNVLTVTIVDDGKGMDENMVRSVTDPFFSTKPGKNVGLGIPLLKGAAEMCDGQFTLESKNGSGTRIRASFALDHPDLPPLGNVKETIFLLCVSNPDVRFRLLYRPDSEEFTFDTKEINDTLEGVPINHPEVIGFLKQYLGLS
jgi:Histidine kinase-, DNA gyrase B-, and HSP90-like ATPase